MSNADKAKELFESGCNCCQAVFCAFREQTNLSEEDALRLSAGFGGGMGRMREVCGAVSGMIMVLSNKFASTDPNDHAKKKELYALIQKAAGEFKEENGSIICRELLGLSEKSSDPNPEARTKEYYKKRPCSELVHCAAEIAEKYCK
ncbi:MAG: C_GCAxxG_C_C family protein [Clostridia bacterium]|nr:C_GCAxxG_C_C family protein [Clostridia bacterium]MBQ7122400.1 C_GCAxxG_C_C family protein [Clostridia bacterium]